MRAPCACVNVFGVWRALDNVQFVHIYKTDARCPQTAAQASRMINGYNIAVYFVRTREFICIVIQMERRKHKCLGMKRLKPPYIRMSICAE